MTLLDRIHANPLPFAGVLGLKFVSAEPGAVEARMLARPDLCTLGGVAHGGAIMSFADTLGGAAAFVNLPDGAKGTTTLEARRTSSPARRPVRPSSVAAQLSIAAAAPRSGRRGSRPRTAS